MMGLGNVYEVADAYFKCCRVKDEEAASPSSKSTGLRIKYIPSQVRGRDLYSTVLQQRGPGLDTPPLSGL
jgi:hypothetical protein